MWFWFHRLDDIVTKRVDVELDSLSLNCRSATSGYVHAGKFLKLSVSQFLYLYNKDNNSTHLIVVKTKWVNTSRAVKTGTSYILYAFASIIDLLGGILSLWFLEINAVEMYAFRNSYCVSGLRLSQAPP